MSSILLRLSLVVGVLYAELGIGDGECSPSSSGFRVFYGKDEEYLAKLSQSELLQFAAKSGESHVVTLSRSSHVGLTQEGANINIDCSLWLANQFPTTRGNKTIQWYFLQLDDSGNITGINVRMVCPCLLLATISVNVPVLFWSLVVFLFVVRYLQCSTPDVTTILNSPFKLGYHNYYDINN